MKLLFKLLLFFICINTSCYASMIHIFYTKNQRAEAQIVRQIFHQKYQVPLFIIKMIQSDQCKGSDTRFLEMCINKKGELIELSNPNIVKIKKSLRTFAREAKDV